MRAYNAAIPEIVAAKAAMGAKVSFLDMYSVLTVDDLVDGVHPGQGGYDKMAIAWNERLVAMREPPPPVSTCSCPCTIWSSGDQPVQQQVATTIPAEVGVQFRTEKDGLITGVRFFKGADNTGTHVGSLWPATGTLPAQATFTDETASGWQQVEFAQPVPVQAHTVYISPPTTHRWAGTRPTRGTSGTVRWCIRRCVSRRRGDQGQGCDRQWRAGVVVDPLPAARQELLGSTWCSWRPRRRRQRHRHP